MNTLTGLIRIGLFTLLGTMALIGCSEDTGFEETGEKVDEMVQDTKRAVEDATD